MKCNVYEINGKHTTLIVTRKFTPDNAHVVLKACDIIAWQHTQNFHDVKRTFLQNGDCDISLTVK